MDLDTLVRKHGKKVYNLAYRITGNRHDAEDITQETFLQVAEQSLRESYGQAEPVALAVVVMEGLRTLNDSGRWEVADEVVRAAGVDHAELRAVDAELARRANRLGTTPKKRPVARYGFLSTKPSSRWKA